MDAEVFWHVIWTTHGCWRPDAFQGDWTALRQFYAQLVSESAVVTFSKPFPANFKGKPFLSDHVSLNGSARKQLSADILKLTAPAGDRVAGQTPVLAHTVTATSIQLIISCATEALSQKVGRLKSRTATLLSFSPEAAVTGPNTWGSGFWYARIDDRNLVPQVVNFVKAG